MKTINHWAFHKILKCNFFFELNKNNNNHTNKTAHLQHTLLAPCCWRMCLSSALDAFFFLLFIPLKGKLSYLRGMCRMHHYTNTTVPKIPRGLFFTRSASNLFMSIYIQGWTLWIFCVKERLSITVPIPSLDSGTPLSVLFFKLLMSMLSDGYVWRMLRFKWTRVDRQAWVI